MKRLTPLSCVSVKKKGGAVGKVSSKRHKRVRDYWGPNGSGCLTEVGVLGIHISSSTSCKPKWFIWHCIGPTEHRRRSLRRKKRLFHFALMLSCRYCMCLSRTCWPESGKKCQSVCQLDHHFGPKWNISTTIGWNPVWHFWHTILKVSLTIVTQRIFNYTFHLSLRMFQNCLFL